MCKCVHFVCQTWPGMGWMAIRSCPVNVPTWNPLSSQIEGVQDRIPLHLFKGHCVSLIWRVETYVGTCPKGFCINHVYIHPFCAQQEQACDVPQADPPESHCRAMWWRLGGPGGSQSFLYQVFHQTNHVIHDQPCDYQITLLATSEFFLLDLYST